MEKILGMSILKIKAETTCNLTMKAYGYDSGYAKVHYDGEAIVMKQLPK